jgi:type IV secretory pathway TrbF-like protein
MFGKKSATEKAAVPERASYTKYYEHDGMLRAYANRSMILAMVFGVIALTSLGFAIYIRLQPPTVIRVDRNGDATVVGGFQGAGQARSLFGLGLLSASAGGDAAPTDIEGRAMVRRFLEDYLTYTPTTVDKQLADALNMMTQNLRQYTLTTLREDDTVGKIRDDAITSHFRIRSIEPIANQPWTYLAFGVKEVNRLQQETERTDRIVGRYTIRLLQEHRSERNPSGLLVAEYKEEQMVGEKDLGLQQKSALLESR